MVLLPHSVGVVAINHRDEVALVTQWRYVHDKESIEIPTGGVEEKDSNLQAAAERELIEETGLRAASWTTMGSIDNSNGVTTDVAHIFLARDLSQGRKVESGDEQTSLSWVPFDRAVSMALEGSITESTSVAALLKLALQRSISYNTASRI